MKYTATGKAAKVAQWATEIVVMVIFMGTGVAASLAPYTAVVSLATLSVLILGYYYLIPTEQRHEYPKHTRATILMLSASHVFFVAMVEAPKQLISAEGLIAGFALVTIIAVGIWKDHILEPMDMDGFEVRIGETGGGSE